MAVTYMEEDEDETVCDHTDGEHLIETRQNMRGDIVEQWKCVWCGATWEVKREPKK